MQRRGAELGVKIQSIRSRTRDELEESTRAAFRGGVLKQRLDRGAVEAANAALTSLIARQECGAAELSAGHAGAWWAL